MELMVSRVLAYRDRRGHKVHRERKDLRDPPAHKVLQVQREIQDHRE
jgi:hypothetical protein